MEGMPTRQQLTTDPVLIGWNGSALTSLLLPLLIMVIARCVNNGDGDGEDGNNNDDNNNNNNNNNRSWWKFWGNNNNNDNNGEDDGGGSQDANIPWWWFSGRREQDPEEEGQGVLVFVYIWSCLLFVALVLYGNFVFRRGSDFEGLQGALIMFTNMAFLSMIMVAGMGAIRVEGRDLEETGWYGQFSVCVFLTCLFWIIDGIVFTILLRKRNKDITSKNSSNALGAWGLFKTTDADTEAAQKNNDTAITKYFQYQKEGV